MARTSTTPIYTPLDATFGAIVTGIDVTALDEQEFAALYDAWLEHALLIFPGQHLSRPAQVAFARRFGPIEQIGGSDIFALSNVTAKGELRGDDDMMKIIKGNMGWHADSTYMEVQAKGAVFSAETVPSADGQTGWADMRAAYDALDDATKAVVEGLSAHHSLHYSQSKVGHTHSDDSDYVGYGLQHEGVPLRPLVKVHPETGRRCLAVGRHAHAVPGMDPADSEQLLADLSEQACVAPRVYHHQWSPGDVVVWDNRCLMHRAMPWDFSEPRVMWHSRLQGDPATETAPLV